MRILVFQHLDCEHPGSLRSYLNEAGVVWDVVELDQGEPIPKDISNYDALWVMGGPMDVWDIEEHPWLVPEKAAIRHWVRELKKPYLGFCLGHQLLADALGGTCGPQRPPEVGIYDIELTKEGQIDPIMQGLPHQQKCLQWHGVRVAQAPEDAVILAKSKNCPIQAMRIGNHAWSTQYHMEIEPDTIENWNAIPAYHKALIEVLGEDGLEGMEKQTTNLMPEFLSHSKILYQNFMKAIV